MTALTQEKLDELRKLHEAAAPGPWVVTSCMDYWVQPEVRGDDPDAFDGVALCGDITWPDSAVRQPAWEANARFIAAARNALPALLDAASASLSHRTRADGLEERVRELEAALKPFAEARGFSFQPDPMPVRFGPNEYDLRWAVTLSDLRRAARALVPEVTNGNETVTGTRRFEPPQCPHCGAPARDGLYYNEALVEETGKRVTAELALKKHREAHTQAFVQGAEAMREAAAKLAEEFATSTHIAADMRAGIFPKSSDTRDAIAAAIRALPPPPAGKPGGE